jgi:nicotinic acid mononucleotide adenylyltransferase
MVRERVAAGGPIRYLVPDKVADHIAEKSLYG